MTRDPWAGHQWSPGPWPSPVNLDQVLEELAALEEPPCVAELGEGCDCEFCVDAAVMEELFPPPRQLLTIQPLDRYL